MRSDWMEQLRHGAAIFGGVWVGMWLARIVGWIFGLDGLVLGAVALVFAILGAAAGGYAPKPSPQDGLRAYPPCFARPCAHQLEARACGARARAVGPADTAQPDAAEQCRPQ
jgi:hypothetical protein